MSRARILFIDDNPDLRLTLAARLRAAGYDVKDAESGAEGLGLTQESDFDLVLLDMLMPQQDGLATYQTLRAQESTRTVPVILFTAMAVEGHWEELADESGGPCYVMGKPYESSELLSRIAQVLRPSA
jgi:two-component system phosphate regulon response regulator PhoB